MHATIQSRERKNIGPTWSRNACLALPLAAAQCLAPKDLEGYHRSWHLNNNDWKRAIQTINKIVHN
jgi:hypothetical protein